jgi:hypothetical protein
MVISGTDILSSTAPYVHVLASSSNNVHATYCSQCFQCSIDVKRCSTCHRTWYCSRACQTQDWIYHKYECTFLSTITDEYDLVRLFLRFVLRYKQDNGIENESTKRTVNDLQTHEIDIRQDRRRYRTFQSVYQLLKQWRLADSFDEATMCRLFCRLVINTLTIHDAIDLKSIGYGLYLDATVYNHSCQPTCHTIFNGIYLSIRTICDQDAIHEWTINYIDLLESFEYRQKYLMENYYFLCQCQRCQVNDKNESILIEKIRYQEEQMDKWIDTKDFLRAYQTSQQLIDYYQDILPVCHVYVVLHHVKHLKLALLMAETIVPSLLQTIMEMTLQRVRLAMGDHHRLTQETSQLCEQYRLEMALQQRQLM